MASQVNGEAAKALTVAILEMPPSAMTGSWSIATDFSRVKDLYRDLRRGPYAYLREPSVSNFWVRYRRALAAAGLMVLMLLLYTLHVRHLVRKRTAELTAALAEKERSEAEARASREQLSALERAGIVSELSSMFAHEVRQPAAAVVAFAGALRMYAAKAFPSDPIIPETAGRLEDEAQKVSAIVERVRGYARGRKHPRRPMALADIAASGLRSFRQSVTSSGVRVNVSVPPELLVEAEPLEMTLAVLNLLKNAAQAMEGQTAREITMTGESAAEEDGRRTVRLIVRDVGPGMTPEALAALSRRGPKASAKADGLGLGLMLVRTVLESHGGSLKFEAASPGTAAVVTLLRLIEQNKGEAHD